MAIVASIGLRDSHGRTTTKRVECEATTLAQALTDVGGLVTTLNAISDLGIDVVTFTSRDVTLYAAPAAGSNLDTGATFVGTTDDGYRVAHKVPGIDDALADSSGSIDIADVNVAAYLANFLTAGNFRLSRGNYVTAWISGTLDK